jgi:deazaflavin-dependent oxidoreductase (nitroreductase family)
MTALSHSHVLEPARSRPRFGGVLWRAARITTPVMIRFAGHRWNPVFAVVEHVGRRTGRRYTAPVAIRRGVDGFVISLAFGSQVDWHRNLVAAGGGALLWRGRRYRIGTPTRIDRSTALKAFHPVQRLLLELAGIDGYVRVTVVEANDG